MTNLRREKLGLPLLQRELAELSARGRTFVARSLYAVVFFGLLGWQFGEEFSRTSADALLELGRGRQFFDQLVLWQLAGVCLFMPVLTAGAVSSEKERGTLALLMITDLSPLTILVEKLASRLFVMMTLLLPAVPVTAYAYSLGGIEPAHIGGSFIVLISTTCYVGAFTLICSSYCSSAAGSLVSSILLGIPLLGLMSGFVLPAISSRGGPGMWLATVATQALSIVACLSIARRILVTRSDQPPRNSGLEILRWMDRFWVDLNTRYAGGRIIVQPETQLPADEPITWRESQKKSLGSVRYLVRILLAVEVPTLALVLLNLDILNRVTSAPHGLLWTVWIVVCLLIASRVSSLIAGERGRQTLDIVLTTPMTGREIVQQFDRGAMRLMLILSLPLLTCYAVRWFLSDWDASHLLYFLSSLASVIVYLPLCSWTAMLVGLTVESQLKGMIGATLILVTWCVWPVLIPTSLPMRETVFLVVFVVFLLSISFLGFAVLFRSEEPLTSRQRVTWALSTGGLLAAACTGAAGLFRGNDSNFGLPREFTLEILVSPATILTWQEQAAVPHDAVAVNFVWYGFLLFFLREFCLHRADRYLGRVASR